MNTLIAFNGEDYLVQVENDANGQEQGRVLSPDRGIYFPSFNLHSILSRGYWEDVPADAPTLDDLLQEIPEVKRTFAVHPERKEWSEDQHPRDDHGRFGEGGGGESASFDLAKWQAMPMAERRDAWTKLPLAQRLAMGDATHTIDARIGTLLDGIPAPKAPDASAAATERLNAVVAAGRITAEQAAMADGKIQDIISDAKAVGFTDEQARALSQNVADHMAGQEIETMGRTLGDHGIRHIEGDADMAIETLGIIPHDGDPTSERLMCNLLSVYHDAGYLTPPSQNFLDMDHPEMSAEHFDANVRSLLEPVIGKDVCDEMSHILATHDDPTFDWTGHPVSNSFRLGDNLALFQAQKMPDFLQLVPDNINTLTQYGAGKISLEDAQNTMQYAIDASDLADPIKARLSAALPEISPVLPKFTLGMVGAKVQDIGWDGDHVAVTVQRGEANEALARVVDLGAKQFEKLLKTYSIDPASFKTSSDANMISDGKTVLSIHMQGTLFKLLFAAWRAAIEHKEWSEDDHPRDERGRFGAGSGGADTTAEPTVSPVAGAALNMARAMGSFIEPPPGWKYGTAEGYITDKGKAYTGVPLPKGMRMGREKQCFKNATDAVMAHPGWTYAEGYAAPYNTKGFATLHAWAVNEDGNAVDPTWPHAELNDYYGVEYPTAQYEAFIVKTGMYGVLGGEGKDAAQVLRTGGLPAEKKAMDALIPDMTDVWEQMIIAGLAHISQLPPANSGIQLADRAVPVDPALLATLRAEHKDFDELAHPRDDHGRFGEGSGEDSTTSSTVAKATEEQATKQTEYLNYNLGPTGGQERRRDDCVALAAGLEGNEAWQNAVNIIDKNNELSLEYDDDETLGLSVSRGIIDHMTNTMGGSSRLSCAVQECTRREFGLKADDVDMSNLSVLLSADRMYGDAYPGIQAFLRASYDQTQSQLKEAGIDGMALYRGMGFMAKSDADGVLKFDGSAKDVALTSAPLSSWSADPSIARWFVTSATTVEGNRYPKDQMIAAAYVPREKIIGTSVSGLGAGNVREIVVLGGSKTPVSTVSWRTKYVEDGDVLPPEVPSVDEIEALALKKGAS
jgi:hypothetical protein